MPLQKQHIEVAFTGGLDTKSAGKLVVPGEFTTLENSGYTTGENQLGKQGGYSQLASAAKSGGGSLSSAEGLMTRSDELLIASSGELHARTSDGWVGKGEIPRVSASNRPVIRNTGTQTGFDCVAAGDAIEVHAWEDSRGGVRASIRDITNGAFYLDDVELSATGKLPRLLVNDTTVFCLYLEAANLKWRTFTRTGPNAWAAAVTLATDAASATPQMDAVFGGADIYIAYRSSANELEVLRVDTAGATVDSATVTENPTRGLCCFWFGGSSRLGVVDNEPGAGKLQFRVFTAALAVHAGPTTIETSASVPFPRLGATPVESSARLFYEMTAAAAVDVMVRYADLTDAGAAGAATVFLRGVGLGSVPFFLNGELVVGVLHESGLQPTAFVARGEATSSLRPIGHIVARCVAGNGGGLLASARVPNVASRGDGTRVWPVNERGRLTLDGDARADLTPEGVTAVEFSTTRPLQALQVEDLLFLCGANPIIYDGRDCVEAGFNLYPEFTASDIAITVGGGVLSAGDYLCSALYEWTDARGRVCRSALMPPVTVTVAASDALVWTLPELRLTDKQDVKIVPFRSTANGQILYRLEPPEDCPISSTTSDSQAFDDEGVSDAELVSNEPWSSAALDAGPVPPCRVACIHKNRVVLGGLDSQDEVALSLHIRNGQEPAFNELVRKRIPREGGEFAAVGSMDEALFVFRGNSDWVMGGEPQDDTGNGAGLSDPRRIGDGGAVDFRSLLLLDAGLVRMTDRGLWMLGHDGQNSYIGAGVEDYNAQAVVAAVRPGSKTEARWYTSGGVTLIWDSFRQKWATFSNHACVGAVEWAGAIVFATSLAVTHFETGYTHNGTAISQTIETAWIKLANVTGLQRIWRFLLDGFVNSACTLTVTIETYRDGDVLSESFNFAAGTVFGAGENMAVRRHMKNQKGSMVRFRLVETLATGTGRGLTFTTFGLQAGVKKGGVKLAPSKSF